MGAHLPTRMLVKSTLVAGGLLAPLVAAGEEQEESLAAYQADLSAGTVSASELLGLSASVVSTIRTPKDFVVAVEALNAGSTKAGFGLSWTPGRTEFSPVSLAAYRAEGARGFAARAWAGTSFSYAQNLATLSTIDYKQEAVALNVAVYLTKEEDPAVASFEGFATCTDLVKLADARTERLNAIRAELRAQGVSDEDLGERAKAALEKENRFLVKALPAYKLCVDQAVARAKARWNASQVSLTVGEARLRNAATGAPPLTLGRVASLAIAIAPNKDGLVNLTAKRNDKGLDTTTITSTPEYKASSLVGMRYTYRAAEAQDLYALAEISNAKAANTQNENVFRYAIGIDKRLSEGLWVELRLGHKAAVAGSTEQVAALMSLKLSPQSSLAR